METCYLDPLVGQLKTHPSPNMDYGKQHIGADGNILYDMVSYEYKTSRNYIERIRFIEEYGLLSSLPIDISSEFDCQNWDAPTDREYIHSLGLWRIFVLSSRVSRKIILGKMGFDEVGIAIGESLVINDALFVYQFSNEPSQIELYISSDENGTITEINRFNNGTMEETIIPITKEGLFYIFNQIFMDINRIDMAKFNPNNLSDKGRSLYFSIMDMDKYCSATDNIVDNIDDVYRLDSIKVK